MRRPAAVALLGAVLLAGCGGSKSTPSNLSRADIAKRATAICTTYTAKAKALPKPAGGDQSAAASFFAAAATIATDQHAALAKLEPDADVERDWRSFLARDAEGARALSRFADAAKGRATSAGAALITQLGTLDRRLDAAARKLGAPACGSSTT